MHQVQSSLTTLIACVASLIKNTNTELKCLLHFFQFSFFESLKKEPPAAVEEVSGLLYLSLSDELWLWNVDTRRVRSPPLGEEHSHCTPRSNCIQRRVRESHFVRKNVLKCSLKDGRLPLSLFAVSKAERDTAMLAGGWLRAKCPGSDSSAQMHISQSRDGTTERFNS